MKVELLGLAVLFAAGSAVAQAATVVNGNDMTRTYDCDGDSAVVNGNRNTLKLENCETVNVNGSQNHVDAGRADAITVLGNGNSVTWSGVKPKVVNMGSNNSVDGAGGSRERSSSRGSNRDGGDVVVDSSGVKAGGVSVGPDGISIGPSKSTSGGGLVLRQDSQTLTHDCKGANAEIHSDSNTVRLTDCRTVNISGDNNTVSAAGVESLELSGDNNVVSWSADRKPRIADTGDGNQLAKK